MGFLGLALFLNEIISLGNTFMILGEDILEKINAS